VEGTPVLVCSVRGTHYAYRDACAACGSTLAAAVLAGTELTCECGARFDIRLAGRALDSDLHLEPLPLLSDNAGIRIAVPRAVPS
jgi:nitrite reductase/ring-hydroxylating ferredoxin subunit